MELVLLLGQGWWIRKRRAGPPYRNERLNPVNQAGGNRLWSSGWEGLLSSPPKEEALVLTG